MNFLRACRRSDKMMSFKKKNRRTLFTAIVAIVLAIIAIWSKTVVDDGTFINHFISSISLSEFTTRLPFLAIIAIIISFDANSPLRSLINVLLFFVAFIGIFYLGILFLDSTSKYIAFEIINLKENCKSFIIWGGVLTILSPLLWYGKGEGWFSVLISSLVVGFFFYFEFNIGMWYINIANIPELIIWVLSIIITYTEISKTIVIILYSLPIGIVFYLFLPLITK